MDIYNKIIELNELSMDAALCTIVQTKGSTPLKPGAKMIVCEDNTTFGTVGGGKLENSVINEALILLKTNSTKLLNIDLHDDNGQSCGGKAEVFIEPICRKKKLYIFGGGHVGKALALQLENLDFDITVIDNRENIFDSWPVTKCNTIKGDFDNFLETISFDTKTLIVIMTYDHDLDWRLLSYCAPKKWLYLGMMGSKRKVKTMKDKLAKQGISQENIEKINMPIGLEIQAQTAAEIAFSVSAQLIMAKNSLREGAC